MMIRQEISREEVNALPLRSFRGKIKLVTKSELLPDVFNEIMQHPVVGFDTETRPAFKKGQKFKIALIQIAIPGKVFLIRVHYTGFTNEIATFLSSPVRKAGIGLHDDIRALCELGDFTTDSFLELNNMATELGIESQGLRKLTALLLKFRISKSQQTSNWENPRLTQKQIHYAATDAWCCLEIYRKLKALQNR